MQLWKTIRIFISSTFRDMHAERDFLVRVVFPELKERCAKRSLHLIDVDLRWGVTEEEAKQGKVIEICFDEIERCRPFFIGLLGERYGWTPKKFEVSDDEKFDWLNEYQGHSVTALEIYHGVLRDEEMKTRAFFYFREADFLKDVPDENRTDFLPESDDAVEKLRALKEEIITKCPVFENYPCSFDGIDENGKVKLADLEEFGKRVLENIWTAICLEYPEDETPPDDLAIERSFHESFIENRTERFIGRRNVLDELNKFASGEDENLLVVTGAAGCGKSAVLAKFAKEYAEKHAEDFVLTHFIGVSPGSTDVRRTLLRLCRELKRKFDIQEEIPTDYYELRQAFVKFLEQAAERGKVLLVLDALNQLDESHFAHHLDWLPQDLPNGVKVIVSTLEGDCLDALHRRNPQPREVVVGALAEAERKEIVRQTLETYRKTLDENQMRLLLAKKESDNPLFLIVACEEMRVYGDFESVSDKLESLAEQVETLFGQVLERVEHDHGSELVTDALVLLECSRYGLLESEMLELLARDGETQLPQAIWARFYRSIQFYLRPPGESGEGLLDFFHRQLSKAVRNRYLTDEETEIAAHQRLAQYFQRKADSSNDKTWTGNYPRGLSELSHHQLAGKLYDDLFQTARDEIFLTKQAETFTDDPELQLQTLQNAITGAAEIDDAAKMAEFIFRHCHQVTKLNNESPLKVFRETGNLERTINLCELWFQHDKERGILQFLWLIWELKKKNQIEDANNLLRNLAGRANELPNLTKDEWQTLALIALSQIFDLESEYFGVVQDHLLKEERKLLLYGNLFAFGDGTISDDKKIKAALILVKQIKDKRERAKAHISIVQTQVNTEQYNEALKTVEMIDDTYWKVEAYATIAIALAKTGRDSTKVFELAFQTVEKFYNSFDKDKAYKSIAITQAKTGKDKEALQTVEKIRNGDCKAETYTSIALSLAQSGKDAAETFELALQTVEENYLSLSNDETYKLIAQALAETEIFELALQTVEKIDSHYFYSKSEAYTTIAQAQVQTGKYKEALQTVKMIDSSLEKIKAYTTIAITLAKKERDATKVVELALQTVENIHNPSQKDEAYKSITVALAETGKYKEALQTAEKTYYDKVEAYTSIAQVLAHKGKKEEALQIVEKIDSSDDKVKAYTSIALALAKIGKDATEVFELALKMVKKPFLGDKGKAYSSIALAQSQTGEDSTKAFELALKTVEKVYNTDWRAEPYTAIAQAQAQTGKHKEALQTVEKIGYLHRDKAYSAIAQAQIQSGEYKEALKTAERIGFLGDFGGKAYKLIAKTLAQMGKNIEALQTVEKINDSFWKLKTYEAIALALAEKGKDVTEVFELAFKVVEKSFWQDKDKDKAYSSITQTQALIGKDKDALQTIEKIDDTNERVKAYTSIAQLQSRSGKDTKEVFELALQTVETIDDSYWKVDAYTKIAIALAETGKDITKILKFALKTAKKVYPNYEDYAYITIAIAQVQTGRYKEALKTVEKFDRSIKAKAFKSIALALAQIGKKVEALQTVKKIDSRYWKDECEKVETYTAIALALGEKGKDVADIFELALQTVQMVDDGWKKTETYKSIALAQAKVNKDEEAWQTMQAIFLNKDQALLQIARTFVEKGNKTYFKKLLIPTSNYLNACYDMSGLLAQLYPKQAEAILEVVEAQS